MKIVNTKEVKKVNEKTIRVICKSMCFFVNVWVNKEQNV